MTPEDRVETAVDLLLWVVAATRERPATVAQLTCSEVVKR